MVKIGLEIHVQLKTKEKLFCKCSAEYREKEPNTNICPICTGQPGAKPLAPNFEAIKNLIKLGIILNCKPVNKKIRFLRKHYFYPDLPKNYQITSEPFFVEGEFFGKRIKEIHLEEDPGRYDLRNGYVDFNRSGVPLAEIVTYPDFSSEKEVEEWLEKFFLFLKYSQVIFEDPGSIRIDVNISTEGERVEVKNVTGINNVVRAIKYEILRQERAIKVGKMIKRETRHFDEEKRITIPLREKEYVEDYRYIPEPDLMPIEISNELIEKVKKEVIIVSEEEEKLKNLGISEDKIKKIIRKPEILFFSLNVFEKIKENLNELSEIITDYLAPQCEKEEINILTLLEKEKIIKNLKTFAENYKKIDRDKISEIIKKMIRDEEINFEDYLIEEINVDELKKYVRIVLEENKQAVKDYLNGNEKAINFLIGKTFQKIRKKVNPQKVKEVIVKLLIEDKIY